jgi:hypothetical protein
MTKVTDCEHRAGPGAEFGMGELEKVRARVLMALAELDGECEVERVLFDVSRLHGFAVRRVDGDLSEKRASAGRLGASKRQANRMQTGSKSEANDKQTGCKRGFC